MRTTTLKVFGTIALLGATCLPVSAAPVTLHYTGDNDVVAWWVFDFNNYNNVLASNLDGKGSDWTTTKNEFLDLAPGNYFILFEVRNTDADYLSKDSPPTSVEAGNPAAFIASIEGVSDYANFVSSQTTAGNWMFIDTTSLSAIGSNENSLASILALANTAAPAFGLGNNIGPNIWTDNHNHLPLDNISSTAEFIWGYTPNPDGPASTQATRGAFYSAFTVPVPVPAAAWLFGSALLGMVGFRRKSQSI